MTQTKLTAKAQCGVEVREQEMSWMSEGSHNGAEADNAGMKAQRDEDKEI